MIKEKSLLSWAVYLIIFSVLGTIITIVVYKSQGFFNYGLIDPNRIGTFGDFIGGFFGTVLSGAATILIYITYQSQKNELSETKKLLSLQSFESNFFELLAVHDRIKQTVKFYQKNVITRYNTDIVALGYYSEGIKALEDIYDDFVRFYKYDGQMIFPTIELLEASNRIGYKSELAVDYPLERIKDVYGKFYREYEESLSHYFRQLYYILKYVDTADDLIKANDNSFVVQKKKYYAGLLQAQLSSSELAMLFYNGLFYPYMYKLVKKYRLVENLNSDKLADTELHKNLYGFPIK